MNSIYSVFIKNYLSYNDSGQSTYNNTKNRIYTIPIDNPDLAFIDPIVKCEMGKAGSLEFTVRPNHPMYKAWLQFKTLVYVDYAGETIFRGRVLTIDVNQFTGDKKIHCEGDLAFLLDSFQEMTHETDRKEIAMNAYIQNILAEHNNQMHAGDQIDPDADAPEEGSGEELAVDEDEEYEDKVIVVGEIPGEYSSSITSDQKIDNTTKKFGSKSWEQTINALENLTKEYGGYLRTRYRVVTKGEKKYDLCYLDWLENYFRKNDSNDAAIQLGENLIDISSTSEVENIFTVLIPIGSKEGKELYLDGYKYHGSSVWSGKYLTVPDLDRLCTEGVIAASKLKVGYHTRSDYKNAIENYGYVYKVEKFDNADTQEKLFEYAIDFIINNYIGGLTSFSVTALDLHHYNPDIYESIYLCGDLVKIKYPDPDTINGTNPPSVVSKKLTILSAEYHLYNPEKNKYSIGIPNTILSKTYGASNKKTSTKKKTGDNQSTGDALDDAKADLGEVEESLWNIVMNRYINNNAYNGMRKELRTSWEANKQYYMGDMIVVENGSLAGVYTCTLNHVSPGTFALNEADGQHRELWRLVKKWASGKAYIKLKDGCINEGNYYVCIKSHTSQSEFDETKWTMVSQSQEDFRHTTTTMLKTQYLFLKKATENPRSAEGFTWDAINGVIHFDGASADDMRQEQKALRMVQKYGKGILYLASGEKVGVTIAGDTGQMLGSQVMLGQDGDGNAVALNLDGLNGLFSLFGVDQSSGDMFKSIDISGFQNFLKFFSKPDAQGNQQTTTEVDGETGAQKTGGKDENGNWRINMNVPFKYIDSKGVEQTVPAGTISAKDFYLTDVPSFHAEFAYIDGAVIPDLYAVKAVVDNLTADTIVTNSFIRSDKIWCNNINANTECSCPSYRLSGVGDEGEDIAYLQNCLSDCLITSEKDSQGKETGKIQFDFYKIGGGSLPTKTFNMAATNFYKDTLDSSRAAVTIGCKDHPYKEGDAADMTLDPDQWAETYGYFMNRNGSMVNTDSIKLIHARALKLSSLTGTPSEKYCVTVSTPSGKDGISQVVIDKVVVGAAIHTYDDGDTANITLNPDQWASFQGVFYNQSSTKTGQTTKKLIHARPIDYDPPLLVTARAEGQILPPPTKDGWRQVNVQGDAYLKPENVKKDITIFGTTGSYEFKYDDDLVITPTAISKVLTPSKDGWKKVTVNGDANFIKANIKDGVTIWGKEGTYKGPTITDFDIYLHNSGHTAVGDQTITSAITIYPAYKADDKWVNGPTQITITPDVSVQNDDIQINNYTTTNDEPTAPTGVALVQAQNLYRAIKAGQTAEHTYCYFDAYVNGTNAKKRYWFYL